jgi:TRAP-type mannitol/chloroaromatic compound transport system permease small subunit
MSDFKSVERTGLVRRLQAIAVLLDRFAEATGRSIAWLTLGMVLITFTVVILRYLFHTGSIALQESVSYLHATVFMLGAAYTLKHDGHVRVDILYQKFTPRTRAWVDLLGTLLLLFPVCLFILFASLEYVADSWAIQEGSREAGGLDGVFLLKTAIPVMAVLLLLQGCSIVLHKLLQLAGHAVPADPDTGLDREL